MRAATQVEVRSAANGAGGDGAGATFLADAAVLSVFALLLLGIHFLTGNRYGFHRDELQFLSDARHLQAGFVAYPPMTALWGRAAIALFGISVQVFRLPAAVANGLTLVLSGLLARELGGRRAAQVMTACAMFPVAVAFSSLMQYNTFDLLAWTLSVFFTARVLRTGNGRNWLGVGFGVGFGVLSKYAIAFPVLSLLTGLVMLPSQRHHFRTRWFWLGALVAVAVASPNLLWLVRHHGITLQMESFIHKRDVRLGRAASYWTDQLKYTLLALPLAITGLVWLVRNVRYRLLSVFFLGPLILLALAKGRGYYLLPAYTVLYAAASVAVERWLARHRPGTRAAVRTAILLGLGANTAAVSYLFLPMFPAGSAPWRWQMQHNEDLANEVGWPEFVAQVAAIRDTLPAEDRTRLAVLANNYGEAGALELYGPRYALPEPISSTNTFHLRGYGPYEPETVLVVGSSLTQQNRNFQSCAVAGHVRLPDGVRNEETDDHPEILVCRHLRGRWPEVWSRSQAFG